MLHNVKKWVDISPFGIVLSIGAIVSWFYLEAPEKAALIVAILIVHEFGHLWMANFLHVTIKGMTLVPLIGAAAHMEMEEVTPAKGFMIFLAGPVIGAFGLFVPLTIAWGITGNPWFGEAIGFVALINALNLLPVYPLDGGRILLALFKPEWQSTRGVMAGGVMVTLVTGYLYPAAMVVGILGFFFLIKPPEQKRPVGDKLSWGLYLSAAAVLAIVAYLCQGDGKAIFI